MDDRQIRTYLDEVQKQFDSGQAREHSYRPAMERLMMGFDKVHAVNEPKHSDHGAPDFVFLSDNNNDLILGYAEAKDIGVSLDKTEKTNQMDRYRGYANLILTDYLEFRFFKNGEKYQTISLGSVQNGVLHLTPENGDQLLRELAAFLELPPEKIKSGKRLAQIMGGKARRIRDNVEDILNNSQDKKNEELSRIYEMMKTLLVHDLTEEKFADMYAQTLVYGLFVARYGDTTPDTFTRTEARDLVPKSNPFLHHFFDHIVGPNFVPRLSYIVDELCEVFSISDVKNIVHKHLKIADDTNDAKDPIIHFYEDFLQEYDASERKKMGAYYTPIPVVKFIVKQVDKILKEDFGISKGLASSETVQYEVDVGQDMRADKRMKANTKQKLTVPRVQVLDPAVGTATFLNETIKHIHKSFIRQEGRWESYVNDNLLKRLHGFELMMAPYTIAHLKLGMTLKETGVNELGDRLGVYLTNSLEEGVPQQRDLFSFGLAEAVSEESRLAAEVKSERPVMVIIGNPPYAVESSNKTKYADSLIDKYRLEPGGLHKLQERNPKILGDDYVKFISFAEDMIEKNGEGIVAMITNHSYIDNVTFRGMRWHLSKTFDKIYILDLHGNAKKKETTKDGSKDENIFDIQQGVAIIIGVKKSSSTDDAKIYHSDIFGRRAYKFDFLNNEQPEFKEISINKRNYLYIQKNVELQNQYDGFISTRTLMPIGDYGVKTSRDGLAIDYSANTLKRRLESFIEGHTDGVNNTSDFSIEEAQTKLRDNDLGSLIKKHSYRPFDNRYIAYTDILVDRARRRTMNQIIDRENLNLIVSKMVPSGASFSEVFLTSEITDQSIFTAYQRSPYVFPLYIYHDDGTRTPNFNQTELKKLTANLSSNYSPEDILDYVYAVLHSPSFRSKYLEFLRIDFPRVPAPSQTEFDHFVPLGRKLRELHLMELSVTDDYDTTYPEPGDNTVEKVKYEDGKVHINDNQYFGNVPEIAWTIHIGGYQPAQKWLKDRKGRTLSDDELDYYQRIIRTLIETDRVMQEIG